ncbi:MAG: hypothetical protein AAFY45_16645 [Bacteroidota bacterium]
MRTITSLILCLVSISIFAQEAKLSIDQALRWRNIGPANQGGRIVDIEAHANDFTKVYVATGSGGVWKSNNAGTSWQPIFDKYETASIGDIALDPQDNQVIWVGTGEANNRNSVSWGNGVYKSTDGGQNFRSLGLENTHQIARILVDPEDSENVCVCAIGHLWGYSGERGLFQTKNGGKSWKKLKNGLPDDGKTGCTDLVRDPSNPNVLYAAFYHRLRQPWHFQSGGEAGGIYKSENGGRSWKKLTNGLPTPTGRIGLAIAKSNPKIVMALVEAEKTGDLNEPGSGVYRSEDGGESWTYVNTYNNRPFYYSQIRINPHNDQRVYLLTTRFMVSEDGGKSFINGSQDQEVHGDFHGMWLDPTYEDRYYLGADKGLSITHDHGKGFQLLDNLPIGQFYRINHDMRDPYYVYGGFQDNGMYGVASFSRDARGILNDSNWKLHWGDGQYVVINPYNWREMYTSMENGSYFSYDPLTHRIKRINPSFNNILNKDEYFSDTITDMASANRWNWSSPMRMSPSDPNTLYVGGNHLYKSNNKGKSWMIISPDLSSNDRIKRKQGVSGGISPDNTGAETHCSISSISISPVNEEIIWIGTDDGQLHITQNGGKSWESIREGVPEVPAGIWVSRVKDSPFIPGTAYLSFDGHRSDLYKPLIFKTSDYGKSWTKIVNGIKEDEVVRVIQPDDQNPNLLFCGTETGIWYSLNQGENWSRFMPNLPTVSVLDLKIHPRDHDLIAGTHGRSIWIMDDISPLQQMNKEVHNSPVYLFEQRKTTLWENVSRGGQRGHFWYAGENPPYIKNTSSLARAGFRSEAPISYYIGSKAEGDIFLDIESMDGKHKKTIQLENKPGINRYYWNLEFDAKPYTSEEKKVINKVFEELIAMGVSSRINGMFERFKMAEGAEEQRKIVEPLSQGYISINLDKDLLMPRAEKGTYKLTLRMGDMVQVQSLEIRDDPLLKD